MKIKAAIFDMDGTLYLGDQLYDFTKELLDTIREKGKRYLFMTNNSSKSVADYVKKHSHAYFHSDLTQSIGKIPVNLKNIDLASNMVPAENTLYPSLLNFRQIPLFKFSSSSSNKILWCPLIISVISIIKLYYFLSFLLSPYPIQAPTIPPTM